LAKNPKLNLTECYGSADTIEKGSFLFGGIYSDVQINAVTGAKSCPLNFQPFSLFDCKKNVICLSLLPDQAIEGAVPFGGFVSSCILTRRCPSDMVKMFVNSYNGCDLYYCTKLDKQKPIPQVIRMPVSPFPYAQFKQAQELKKTLLLGKK
jgi:hypothetical protein